MRKSKERTGSRPIRAGIAVAATAAAVVAGVATPAYADATGTLSPATAPIGGGTSVAFTSTGTFTGMTFVAARFILSTATCATTYGTTSTVASTPNPSADTALDGSTPNNIVNITTPNLAAGTYIACVYGATSGTLGTGTALLAHSTNTLAVSVANTVPTLSTGPTGPVGGGNVITATTGGPYLGSATAPAVIFTTAATCPTTYSTTSPAIVASSTKGSSSSLSITVPQTLAAGTTYTVCVYAGNTVGTSVLLTNKGDVNTTTTTYTTRPTTAVSPAQGSSGAVTNVAVSSTSPILLSQTQSNIGVIFNKAACPAKYDASSPTKLTPSTVTKVTSYKLIAPTNSSIALNPAGAATTDYNVCIYGGITDGVSPLINIPAKYTVAPSLSITGLTAATPTGGPAQGNSAVSITGTGFPTANGALLEVDLGGSPVNIISNTSTQIDGTTTAHAAGAVAITVTTAAGTKTTVSTPFTYTYGITVAPNTAPSPGSSTPFFLDVMGAGFDAVTNGIGWASATPGAHSTTADGPGPSARGHVFLVGQSSGNPAFDPTGTASDNGTTWNTYTTNPITECVGAIPVSDNEVICTLDLYKVLSGNGTAATTLVAGPVPNGAYNIVVVNNGAVNGTQTVGVTQSIISSGSTFTVAPY